MNNKNDLRIIRTYKSLTEAFLQLMSEKPFEDITISELCDKAMIRRTTFYKHFADKYEFFGFFVQQLQEDFDKKNAASAEYKNSSSFYIRIIWNVLDFLKEHEQLVQMVLNSNLLFMMLDIISERITLDITRKIKIGAKKGINIPASPEIMAYFFTGALIHTVKWWITHKKNISQEKLIQEVKKILFFAEYIDAQDEM